MKNNCFYFIFLYFIGFSTFSQSKLNSFLIPSDTLNKPRRNTIAITETAVASATLIGLNQLWYADYPKSKFHFINDNSEWLQMDKMGHAFSTYQLGSLGANALKWSGCNRKSQLIFGSTIGLTFMTVVEVFDGNSSQWGFSWGDMAANATGTALYVSQELAWKEQRIVPKFSFHTTHYAALRPNVLGTSVTEQVLKDYNGQTYWFSANIHSFFKQSKIPNWVNVAVGYGADGMISGNIDSSNAILYPNIERTRQFYLSFDADLTKIHTKSHFLKTIFAVINTVKIPAPTLEVKSNGVINFHCLYF